MRCLVSDGLRAQFVLGLQSVLPGAGWGLASSVLAPLRRVKDAEEIELLRAAAHAADRAIAGNRPGTGDSSATGEVLFGELVHEIEYVVNG